MRGNDQPASHIVRTLAVAGGATLAACSMPLAGASSGGFLMHDEQVQELIKPFIWGVTYDDKRDVAYVSACPKRKYACDLIRIDLATGGVRTLPLNHQYGYFRPALDPSDGRRLYALRAARELYPADEGVVHQLVEIDLQTGIETIISEAAADERFERVYALGDGRLAVLRSFKSAIDAVCQGDYCTDALTVDLYADRKLTHQFPGAAPWPGQYTIEIVPAGPPGVFAGFSSRYTLPNAHPFFLLEAGNDAGFRLFDTQGALFEYLVGQYGSAAWRSEPLNANEKVSRWIVRGTDGAGGAFEQSEIYRPGKAIYVSKQHEADGVALNIGLVLDQNGMGAVTRVVSVKYPVPVDNTALDRR